MNRSITLICFALAACATENPEPYPYQNDRFDFALTLPGDFEFEERLLGSTPGGQEGLHVNLVARDRPDMPVIEARVNCYETEPRPRTTYVRYDFVLRENGTAKLLGWNIEEPDGYPKGARAYTLFHDGGQVYAFGMNFPKGSDGGALQGLFVDIVGSFRLTHRR